MSSGGGGGTTSTTPQFSEQQLQMQTDLANYIHQMSDATGGPNLGSYENLQQAYGVTPEQQALANTTIGGIQNQFTGAASGMDPWMNTTQQAINTAPLANTQTVNAITPTATGYTDPNTAGYMGAVQGYYGPGFTTQQAVDMASAGQNYMTGMPTSSGGTFNPYSIAGVEQAMGGISLNADAATQAATDYMTKIVAPTLEQTAVYNGTGAMSGAALEAQTNAAAAMAVPITSQVMANQQAVINPQVQTASTAQLQQQAAQQGLESQGYGGNISGGLAYQNAQNQLAAQNLQSYYTGALNTQQAQNQLLSQGQQGSIQGGLSQQQAQNQYLGTQQQANLQGLSQQGQNQFQYAMSIPQQQQIMLNNYLGAQNAQMGLISMDQAAEQQILAAQMDQWNRALAAAAGTAYTAPGSTTTSSGSGGSQLASAGAGALSGAATGAVVGSAVPGIGTAIGAAGGAIAGGAMGYFCWIADALYGEDSEDATAARAWVGEGWTGDLADFFREWYYKNGMDVAYALLHDHDFKSAYEADYRDVFDEFVRKGKAYLANGVSMGAPSPTISS